MSRGGSTPRPAARCSSLSSKDLPEGGPGPRFPGGNGDDRGGAPLVLTSVPRPCAVPEQAGEGGAGGGGAFLEKITLEAFDHQVTVLLAFSYEECALFEEFS